MIGQVRAEARARLPLRNGPALPAATRMPCRPGPGRLQVKGQGIKKISLTRGHQKGFKLLYPKGNIAGHPEKVRREDC